MATLPTPPTNALACTHGDKQLFLQTPENFDKHMNLWNEVEAAQHYATSVRLALDWIP